MPATYEPIATTTLGSAASTISFTSIGSGYTDLRLIVRQIGGGGSPGVIFNSDSGTNYSTTSLRGNGTTADSVRATSQTRMASSLNDAYDYVSFFTVDIFSYAGSTNKTSLFTFSNDFNGSGNVLRQVGLWRSTAAITSITLNYNGTNEYRIGTTATLYGILKN